MHNTYHINQYGGGSWAMYCALCHLPFYNRFRDDEVINKKHELYKLRNVDLTWLERGLGYDKHTQSIIPVGGDDGYGRFPIRGKVGKEFVNDTYNKDAEKEFDAFGIVYHEDCVRYVNSYFTTPLTYTNNEKYRPIINYQYPTKYESQFYQWKMALEREGADYFHSPMIPQGRKTRERINKLFVFMTPRVSPNVPVVLCPSHKTHEECMHVPNKCVWGKTGKCSRKRTIEKQSKKYPLFKNSGDYVMCNWNEKTNKCSRRSIHTNKQLRLQYGGNCTLEWNQSNINTIKLLDMLRTWYITGIQCDIPISVFFQNMSFTQIPDDDESMDVLKECIRIAKEFPIIYKIYIHRKWTKKPILVDNDIEVDDVITLFNKLEQTDKMNYDNIYEETENKAFIINENYKHEYNKCVEQKTKIEDSNKNIKFYNFLSKKQPLPDCKKESVYLIDKYTGKFCNIEIKSYAYEPYPNDSSPLGTKNTYSLYDPAYDERIYNEFKRYITTDPQQHLIQIISQNSGSSHLHRTSSNHKNSFI